MSILKNVDNSDPQMTLEVLRELRDENKLRVKLWQKESVNNIDGYNKKYPNKRLPQILFVADECQVMFKEHTSGTERLIQQEISEILNIIATQGRSQGIHMLLATQQLDETDISGQILKNLTECFLLMSAPTDSDRLVPDSSDMTSRQMTGMACYYHKRELQSQVQTFYANDEELANAIDSAQLIFGLFIVELIIPKFHKFVIHKFVKLVLFCYFCPQIQEVMDKSFVYGVAVTDYNFTGREEETRRLKLNFENGINSILISPRRWGKTSLVDHVCRQLEGSDIITVRLDIFGCKSEYDFYNVLAAAVLKQTATKVQIWMDEAKDFLARLTPRIHFPVDPTSEISVSLGITPETHSPEEILNMVEVIAKRKDRHIVVCIDEFQQVGEFEDTKTVQARLRSVWQHHHYTSYCLFGSKRHMMSKIFLNRSMPFYQFGDLMWLQKIPISDWTDYIISHFENADRQISEELVTKICESVELYPSYVQHLASIVLNHTPQGGTAKDEVLPIAIKELISTNEALYMQQIEPLSGYQMNLLRAIVSGIHSGYNEKKVRSQFDLGSPSNLVRLRDALIERDLIYSEMRQLYITDPVFSLWFKQRFL